MKIGQLSDSKPEDSDPLIHESPAWENYLKSENF